MKCYILAAFGDGGSSNGRTTDFGSVDRGSNPCPPAKKATRRRVAFFIDRTPICGYNIRNRRLRPVLPPGRMGWLFIATLIEIIMKQYEAVIQVMEENGGFATLGYLYQTVLDVPGVVWKTKTPFASIRRIVQDDRFFFKIKPGLWALKKYKSEVLQHFQLDSIQSTSKIQKFEHLGLTQAAWGWKDYVIEPAYSCQVDFV